MRATLYRLTPRVGRLAVMARPRGGGWLADEMAALSAAGVDVLVSTLTPREVAELDLSGEARSAADAGLAFVSFPIPDRAVPDVHAARGVLGDLHATLRAGRSVAIHCRMGIGRSSLMAAALLVLDGFSLDDAWDQAAKARGLAVPDTPEQRSWLRNLA